MLNSSTPKFREETDAIKALCPKIASGCQGNRRDDTQPWRWGWQDQEKTEGRRLKIEKEKARQGEEMRGREGRSFAVDLMSGCRGKNSR